MSAATTAPSAAAPPPGRRKKSLLLGLAAVAALVLALGAGAAVLIAKQRAAAHDDADDGAPAGHAAAARDPKHPPAFVALEPFTVNLADKESDRYAQIGITLELTEPETAEAIKVFMPAIRNNILLALSHKRAVELLERDGKTRLADDIRRETARGLGVDGGSTAGAKAGAQPVAAVYFSTFIIQ